MTDAARPDLSARRPVQRHNLDHDDPADVPAAPVAPPQPNAVDISGFVKTRSFRFRPEEDYTLVAAAKTRGESLTDVLRFAILSTFPDHRPKQH